MCVFHTNSIYPPRGIRQLWISKKSDKLKPHRLSQWGLGLVFVIFRVSPLTTGLAHCREVGTLLAALSVEMNVDRNTPTGVFGDSRRG